MSSSTRASSFDSHLAYPGESGSVKKHMTPMATEAMPSMIYEEEDIVSLCLRSENTCVSRR